jgi:hypothetical protein
VRTILFVAAAVLLAACDTGAGWVPDDNGKYAHAPPPPRPNVVAQAPLTSPPPSVPPPEIHRASIAPAPPVPLVNTHCQAVARQRAADARANGYSFEMEDAVYDGTYKDCVEWDSRHGH